jgi:hypothetical protein
MDGDRIERALREGPPNEPTYIPGAFRRRRPRWWMAASATLVVATLVVGIAVGIGLSELRHPAGPGSGHADPAVVAREVIGTWKTGPIPFSEWRSRLLGMGYQATDLDAFLVHDPMTRNVVYSLIMFPNGTLTVTSSLDGAGFTGNSAGPYLVLDDGRITWNDEGCSVTFSVSLKGQELTFGTVATRGCNTDERIANSAFFNLGAYSRIPGG